MKMPVLLQPCNLSPMLMMKESLESWARSRIWKREEVCQRMRSSICVDCLMMAMTISDLHQLEYQSMDLDLRHRWQPRTSQGIASSSTLSEWCQSSATRRKIICGKRRSIENQSSGTFCLVFWVLKLFLHRLRQLEAPVTRFDRNPQVSLRQCPQVSMKPKAVPFLGVVTKINGR